MTPPETKLDPWEVLRSIIATGDVANLTTYLDELSSGETARAISRLDQVDQQKLLILLNPEDAADLIEELPEAQAKDLIEDMPDEQAAAIVEELASDQQADLLGSLEAESAEAILQEMDPDEATEARHLLSFDPNTAGGLMITEYLVYPEWRSCSEILEDLQKNSEVYKTYDVLYAYIVDSHQKLKGVVKLRDLILSPRERKMDSLMISNPIFVRVNAGLEDLDHVFNRYDFFGIPVVDHRDRLLGLVRRSSVREALEAKAESRFLKASGILSGEELRTLDVNRSLIRRLSVLIVKIGLNLISASVISIYSDTISSFVALALFLPIISDLGGSAGNQSVAVSIRELSLGVIKPNDYMFVFWHEFKVGLRAGAILALLLGMVATLWKGSFLLGSAVSLAMFLSTVIAFCIGGMLPLALKKLKIDPAVASSAILTTITDCIGFFLLLALAQFFLHHFG